MRDINLLQPALGIAPPAPASGWRLSVLAMLSRDDQVVSLDPMQAWFAEPQTAGINAKLIPLSGIAHDRTNRITDGLRLAVR